jgi:hypothetical protein
MLLALEIRVITKFGKPDLCCYWAAEGIQQDNDLKKKY